MIPWKPISITKACQQQGLMAATKSQNLDLQNVLSRPAKMFLIRVQRVSELFRGIFMWFELLFAAQPTRVDYGLIICGTLCAIGAGIPFPLMGVLFGQIIDNFNSATCDAQSTVGANPVRYESTINDKVIKTAYIGAIAFVLIYGHLTCWNIISQRLAYRMRTSYVSALLRQPPSYFDTHGSSGQVSSRLNGDIAAIQAGTSEKVGNIITTISFFVTVFIIAFIKQPSLAAILTSILPAFLLSGTVCSKYVGKFLKLQNADVASAASIASEALSHHSVVQAFGAAPRLESKFASYMASARRYGIMKAAITATQTGLLYFIAYSGNALAFWQGSIRIGNSVASGGDGATVGEVYAIVYLIVDACVMLGGIAPSLPFLSAATAAYERLMTDINANSAIDGTSTKGANVDSSMNLSIDFQNVSFEYRSRPGQLVLSNINLSFPPGSYTAIVGLSGSGKSTVAALIARLYDPSSGVIRFGGKDLRDLNVRSLRSVITYVPQEPSLFDRSIFENIALGLVNSRRPEHKNLQGVLNSSVLSEIASKGQNALVYASSKGPDYAKLARLVKLAAEQASAASFIERLDKGYGTAAGLGGSQISGGQRQRISLARALIRDPEILVLDEATSALDSSTEKELQLAIEGLAAQKRTIISIAHRISTIRNADKIIVMSSGRSVQVGTFDDLAADSNGEFAKMVRLQTLGDAESSDDLSLSDEFLDSSTVAANDTAMTNENAETCAKHHDSEKLAITTGADKGRSYDADDESSHSQKSVFKNIRWLLRPSAGLLFVAITAAIIVGCTFSGAGVIFGFVVGALNPCQSTVSRIFARGRFYAGMYFLLAGVELVANFLTWWTFGIVAERLLYNVRVLSLSALLEQTVFWHSSKGRTPTGLLSIITKDSMAMSNFSGSTFGTVFAICVNIIVAVVISNIFAWKIALVCMATLPILLGSGFMQLRMLVRYEERHQHAFATATSLATEAIESIRSVAILSLEHEYMDSFQRLLLPPRKEVVRASATTNVWLAISYTTGIFINALAYWWGSQLIMKGEYTQRDFLIILVAMLTSAQLWSGMFALAPEFSRARLAMRRVMEIVNIGSRSQFDKRIPDALHEPPDIEAALKHEGSDTSSTHHCYSGASVYFDKVSFAYPNRPDACIVNEMSFKIGANQFCGLVGPSGAGKSTIMNLILRFYMPSSGTISVGDQDLKNLPSSFRDTIALVPQDPTLFNGNVKFNVGIGAPPGHDASQEDIEEACRLANIHDVIMALPDGYDTECGPSASRFSGGQKQRLAIARALVRKPRLLLLDESTSALDAASEAALEQGLAKASQNTTVIAITHRLRTVQKADVILMLDDGRIVDHGNHSELMERNESYRLIATQQMLR